MRLRDRRAPVAVCLVAAAALSGWFLLNTALLSDGPLARRLAGLLVLWTIPTALVALSLRPRELSALAHGLVALALLLVPIEALAITRAGSDVFRFSPIADLDVISAGLIPSIGAIAALSLRPASARGRILQLAIVTVLVAAAVVPGSRGPVLALVAATLALVLVRPPRLAAAAGVAVALGLVAGSAIGSNIGSLGYLTSTPASESFDHPDGRARPRPPISTLSVRRHWIEDAVRETPERPIFGHGVGMFEDNTPEARLMGVDGQRTYPHNTFVEAAYSLGVLGLLAFVAFVGSALVALVAVVRTRVRIPEPAVPFALALGVFAFVNTNVSGEIGSDALLWSAVAIALALYAVSTRSATGLAGRMG